MQLQWKILKAQENSLIWQLSLQNISRRKNNRLQGTCSRNCNNSRATKLITFFVPTIENGEELCIRMCFSFFSFVFHAKSATINNHQTGLSDLSFQRPFSRDSNHIKNFQ